ncbi:hypothetical protein BVRB_8g187110 [Beta vulgaris subsp. vulgaris]|nr:hypothetical protein BVRB_8g187110 [Beta vulgaris subsp. vulgaris]
MAPPKISSLILFSILLLLTFPKSSSLPTYLYSICPNTTFPSNSKYKSNLNTLLHSLSSNVTTNHSGFYITSVGNGTSDAAYGLFLCRGDQNATSCTDCVKTATTTDLPRTYCPTSNVATIWYDECMVRYSNVSLLGKMDDSPKVMLTNTQRINGNQTAFGEIMRKTVNDMAVQTANNRSGMKFTAKTVNFTSLVTLYALEQCTPDLNANDCGRCLRAAIEKLSVMQGARILQPSCNIRYEIYPFYNGAVNFSLSPTIKTAEHGRKKVSAKVIIAIVAPIVVIVLAILAIYVCFIKKRAKHCDSVPTGYGEDFTKVESLQYDLLTLQTATNNFSDENKLGEGGFGGVFKAWKRWRDGMPLEFVDESIKDSCPINEVMRCMHLGLLCVQESIDDRPTMATAVLMLDSHSITLPMPQQPGFFIKSYVKGIGSDQSTSKSMPLSINDISVTEVEAR